jgi:hypothetical protein
MVGTISVICIHLDITKMASPPHAPRSGPARRLRFAALAVACGNMAQKNVATRRNAERLTP